MQIRNVVNEEYEADKRYQDFMNKIQDMLPNGYKCEMCYLHITPYDYHSDPLYKYYYYVKIYRKGRIFKKLVGMLSTSNLEIMGAGTSCPTLFQIFKEQFVNYDITVTYSKNRWDWVK